MKAEQFLFTKLVDEVRAFNRKISYYPNGEKLKLIDEQLSEKHRVAFQLTRLDNRIGNKSLSTWVEDFKKDEFDDLFQYAERGYAQGYYTFKLLLKILYSIRDMGTPEAFSHKQIVENPYDSITGEIAKSVDFLGVEIRKELMILSGKGLEEFNEVLDTIGKEYIKIDDNLKIQDFNDFILSYDDEDVSVEKSIKQFKEMYKKELRPYVKLTAPIEEFNLLDAVLDTLENYRMHDEIKKLKKRLIMCGNLEQSDKVLKEYVNFY